MTADELMTRAASGYYEDRDAVGEGIDRFDADASRIFGSELLDLAYKICDDHGTVELTELVTTLRSL